MRWRQALAKHIAASAPARRRQTATPGPRPASSPRLASDRSARPIRSPAAPSDRAAIREGVVLASHWQTTSVSASRKARAVGQFRGAAGRGQFAGRHVARRGSRCRRPREPMASVPPRCGEAGKSCASKRAISPSGGPRAQRGRRWKRAAVRTSPEIVRPAALASRRPASSNWSGFNGPSIAGTVTAASPRPKKRVECSSDRVGSRAPQ